jgi:hypothetical protein
MAVAAGISALSAKELRTRSPAPEKSAEMDFWELFTREVDNWVTSRPLSEMITVLRRIIDKQWNGDEPADEALENIEPHVVSLLYYAWDRAREVETLQVKLQETEATLRAALRAVVKH